MEGTVCIKHDYPLHHTFDDAFNQSPRVIFEVDLDGLSSPLAQNNILKKGFYLDGEILKNVLSKDSYAIVKAQLAKRGLEIAMFHHMKPWMIATAVMALELKKLRFESAYGVDQHFFEKAHAGGKTIQRLEAVLVGIRDYPELYEALIVKRDKDWLPDIEIALQEKKPVFIVVGALLPVGK
jgi:uncharacterized protein YbaP (TraB family)